MQWKQGNLRWDDQFSHLARKKHLAHSISISISSVIFERRGNLPCQVLPDFSLSSQRKMDHKLNCNEGTRTFMSKLKTWVITLHIKKSGKRLASTNNFLLLGFLLADLDSHRLFICKREVSSMKLAILQGMVRPPMGWSNPNSSSAWLNKSWNEGWFK